MSMPKTHTRRMAATLAVTTGTPHVAFLSHRGKEYSKAMHEVRGHSVGRHVLGVTRPNEARRLSRDERDLSIRDVGFHSTGQAHARAA